jgi:hypothetical protein
MIKPFALALLLVGLANSHAQSKAGPLAPPIPPLLITYRYWPEQFIQWLGPELPYSMIELYADRTLPKPLYDVVLTDRTSGKRLHYSNQQQMVDIDKLNGEAYLTRIAFAAPEQENTGSTWNLSFTTQDGKPVLWRFIQGSDVAEQGGGLTPMPNVPVLMFMYREQAAVAGEGTALQIGTQVSEADLWKEISHPPYFVAYRGARSVGVNIAILAPGTMRWKVDESPASLTLGAAWKLSSADGKHLVVTVKKMDGSEFTLVALDEHLPGRAMTIEAQQSGSGWSIQKMRISPEKQGDDHGFALSFEPALPLEMQAPPSAIRVEMQEGKKTKVGAGTLTQRGDVAHPQWLLQMKTPDWARSKSMLEDAVLTQNSIVIESKAPEGESGADHKAN